VNDALRPAAYAAGLAALFGAALGMGALTGDATGLGASSTGSDPAQEAHRHDASSMGSDPAQGSHGAGGDIEPAGGLAVADRGLRLVAPATASAGARERFAFRVVDGHGATVRDFDVQHTKRLHLIAVRRDLTGFQHLHPRQDAGGAWSTDLTLRDAGAYRVFADFKPSGGERATLASDVLVAGDFRPRALPAPARSVRVDGYDVALDAPRSAAGHETTLTYTISRGGRPVAVQPYLGAAGHLVALRAGDLAYLHVHPMQSARAGQIAFAAHYPSPGRYRLFLQFRVDGRVHTAALTQEAA
jgi:hypothetical protein